MSQVELSDALLAKLAGWEAVKQARGLLAAGRVLTAEWQPPRLHGTVQEGSLTYRAGLVIKSATDAENLCTCRDARQRGIICAHSVAVGLYHLRPVTIPFPPIVAPPMCSTAKPAPRTNVKALRRAAAGTSGEPLELCVILPPNFAQAVTKGRVMLCLEGRWKHGRGPLNALPGDTSFSLAASDAVLLDIVEALSDGDTPAVLMLNAAQFADLLPRLAGHPRVTLGKVQAMEIINEPLRLALRAALETNGEIVLHLNGPAPAGVLRGATAWVFHGQRLQPLGLPAGLEEILNGPLRLPRARVPQFLNVDWPRLVAQCDVEADFAPEDFTLAAATPRFTLHLAGGVAMLQAKLECHYGEKRVIPGSAAPDDALWLADPQAPTCYRTRNLAAEQAALGRLRCHGFTGPDAQGLWHLQEQNRVLTFFAREFPKLEKEWVVTLEERLERSTEKNFERIEPRFQITSSGEQWFDLSVAYDTRGGERFAAADIQRLLLSGQSHTRLKSGKFALLDTGAVEELQEVLLDCAPQQHAGGYRVDNAQAGFLDATLRQQAGWQVQVPAAWAQRAAQQRGEAKPAPPPLAALESVLRPYQKDGVAWLHFLRANGFGGVLADEMGLGKTLQVLALLDGMRNERSADGSRTPHLVVCPTSLVFNWVAEAAKFTPGLRVLALHGAERRERFARIGEHDLIITSYALLRRDAELYRALEFDTVILDEAQHIKNRQTQNAQAVKAVRARHRLVLTGTPLENSVLDLWSIFDFLMPGYLGSATDFRERYEVAITRDKSAAAQDRLARRLKPFLLRRLKRDVATDLPEKIEQVSYCELNDDQRALYQQVLAASRREILNAVDANGLAKSRMVVLTALLRLRQICCDLRLLGVGQVAVDEEGATPPEHSSRRDNEADARGGTVIRLVTSAATPPSGKVELFGELLEEVLDGGHRVLVFSQFTRMLGLLRDQLAAQGVACCYLDGSTKDRAQVVGTFQRDARIPVFLISLKAGGVGLNLTGADTVIHFDPWWNPAVEAQATDRAHRIGQQRVVTSYKLITRGTVEEKILHLQARKRALFAGMLGGEEQLAGALNWEEIQDLLAE